MINNVTMTDDQVVASYEPRGLFSLALLPFLQGAKMEQIEFVPTRHKKSGAIGAEA